MARSDYEIARLSLPGCSYGEYYASCTADSKRPWNINQGGIAGLNLLHEIGPHLTGLEQLKAMLETDRRSGIGETLDIRLVEAEDGRVVCEATPDIHVYNPLGTVHGGFTATMLDFACGYAVLSKMMPGQSFSTLEIKVAYHKAMTRDTGPVRAEGKIVTFGRRLAYTESRLTDQDGKLYASATSSLIVLSA